MEKGGKWKQHSSKGIDDSLLIWSKIMALGKSENMRSDAHLK